MRNGIENTNLEKIVMIKSTSPLKDFIIIFMSHGRTGDQRVSFVPRKFSALSLGPQGYGCPESKARPLRRNASSQPMGRSSAPFIH